MSLHPESSAPPFPEHLATILDEERGLWQPGNIWYGMPAIETVRADMAAAAEDPERLAALTVDQYQWWAALDWKERHTSPAAVRRFFRKLYEEAGSEVLLEYDELDPGDAVPYVPELIGELGDIAHVNADILTNARLSLMHATRYRLHANWAPVAPPPTPVTLGDVDNMIADGLQPRPFRTEMDDYRRLGSDPDHWELAPDANWGHLVGALGSVMLRGIDEAPDGSAGIYAPSAQDQLALNNLAGDAFLFIAYTARRWGGGSLQDVVRENYLKVTGRVRAGRIDKADGTRG